MKYQDPSTVVCSACHASQPQRVPDLLALRAVCQNCGASLADNGRKMHEFMATVSKQMNYVAILLMELEEDLGVPFPDNAGWDIVKTKADFVRAVVSHLTAVAPAKADAAAIARAFDQSL